MNVRFGSIVFGKGMDKPHVIYRSERTHTHTHLLSIVFDIQTQPMKGF